MTYIEELEQALHQRVRRIEDLAPILVRAFSEVREWIRATNERIQAVNQRIDPITDRLLIVDTLPADAPYGALIRLRQGTQAERIPLYLGNGPGQPLTKLTPTAV